MTPPQQAQQAVPHMQARWENDLLALLFSCQLSVFVPCPQTVKWYPPAGLPHRPPHQREGAAVSSQRLSAGPGRRGRRWPEQCLEGQGTLVPRWTGAGAGKKRGLRHSSFKHTAVQWAAVWVVEGQSHCDYLCALLYILIKTMESTLRAHLQRSQSQRKPYLPCSSCCLYCGGPRLSSAGK